MTTAERGGATADERGPEAAAVRERGPETATEARAPGAPVNEHAPSATDHRAATDHRTPGDHRAATDHRGAGAARRGTVRRAPLALGLPVGAVALLAAVVVSFGVGPIDLSPGTVLSVLAERALGVGAGEDRMSTSVVWNLRAPRVLFAALTGAALAVSGAALQSLFRNPLADPGIIGVSGGASAGAVTAIVLTPPVASAATGWLVPASAFLGGLFATAVIYLLARPGRAAGTSRLLLVGIAIGSGFAALTGFLTFVADDEELDTIVFWQLGSFARIDWLRLGLVAGPVLAGIAVVLVLHRRLDMLTLGERQARHLGLNVRAARATIVAVTALLTGACVSFAGTIGFVGLVVPHIVRLAFGPAHRAVLPLSALVGGLLLVVADSAARTVAPPAEVPIGVFTAALGAPFFLWLVLRSREVRI